MRVKDRGSRWSPNIAPDNPEELPLYLFNELSKLGQTLYQVDRVHLDRQSTEPDKPRDGDIALFNQNVVGGKSGIYYFKLKDDDSGNGQWWFLTAEEPS
jgi:hypothetical protein